MRLITNVDERWVPGSLEPNMARDISSFTEERHKLRSKRSRGSSNLLEKQIGNRSEKEQPMMHYFSIHSKRRR